MYNIFHKYCCYTKRGGITASFTLRNHWGYVTDVSKYHNAGKLSMGLKDIAFFCSKAYNTLLSCHNFPVGSREAARIARICETSLFYVSGKGSMLCSGWHKCRPESTSNHTAFGKNFFRRKILHCFSETSICQSKIIAAVHWLLEIHMWTYQTKIYILHYLWLKRNVGKQVLNELEKSETVWCIWTQSYMLWILLFGIFW